MSPDWIPSAVNKNTVIQLQMCVLDGCVCRPVSDTEAFVGSSSPPGFLHRRQDAAFLFLLCIGDGPNRNSISGCCLNDPFYRKMYVCVWRRVKYMQLCLRWSWEPFSRPAHQNDEARWDEAADISEFHNQSPFMCVALNLSQQKFHVWWLIFNNVFLKHKVHPG